MPNLDQESLFSLELVVERLRLSKTVVCRFPSVAFRLLDFPTLIIHHLELDLAEKLRQKINADPHYKLPVKFSEFQDREGYFVYNKGKSCLFKVSPNSLQTHLCNAPLYVMIMDTYPTTPKLVGSCSIPLDGVMAELYEDISHNGVCIPQVSGAKGSFEIYNLIGTTLGSIEISYRLLSLGGALLRHIPDNMVAQLVSQEKQTTQPTSEQFWKASSVSEVIPSQQQNAEQAIENEPSQPITRSVKDDKTQTDELSVGSIGVQTMRRKPVCKSNRISLQKDNNDTNEITTNVVCPPPLYYNSEAEINTSVSLFRKLQASMQQENWSDDGFSDDDTIRLEDKFLDTDEQVYTHIQEKSLIPTERRVQQQAVFKIPDHSQMHADQKVVSQLSHFPILQAIVAEIMQLQGLPKALATMVNREEPNNQETRTRHELHRHELQPSQQSRSPCSKHDKKCHSHEKGHPLVPHNKSWLSSEKNRQPTKTSHSELVPRLTQTLRLRLLKHNPRLLKELEEKEEQAKCKQYKGQQKHSDRRTEVATDKELSRESALGPGLETKVKTHNSKFDLDNIDSSDITHNQHSYRRPIPTPRSTVSAINKKLINDNENFTSSEVIIQFPETVENSCVDNKNSSTINLKQQAINSNKQQADIKNQRSLDFGKTVTLSIHKVDKMSKEERKTEVASSILGVNSGLKKDVEDNSEIAALGGIKDNALFGSEPSLQKVFDSYDSDRSPEVSLNTDFQLCQEPDLKKFINQYSDDSDGSGSEIESLAFQTKSNNIKLTVDSRLGTSNIKPNREKSAIPSVVAERNLQGDMRLPIIGSSGTIPIPSLPVPLKEARSQEFPSISRHTPRSNVWSSQSQELTGRASSTSFGHESYSEAFDSLSDDVSQHLKNLEVKDIKLLPDSKLGYTWT